MITKGRFFFWKCSMQLKEIFEIIFYNLLKCVVTDVEHNSKTDLFDNILEEIFSIFWQHPFPTS